MCKWIELANLTDFVSWLKKKSLKSDQLAGNLKQGLSEAAVLDEIPSKRFSFPSPFHIFSCKDWDKFLFRIFQFYISLIKK